VVTVAKSFIGVVFCLPKTDEEKTAHTSQQDYWKNAPFWKKTVTHETLAFRCDPETKRQIFQVPSVSETN
jgi:hypothetical protein